MSYETATLVLTLLGWSVVPLTLIFSPTIRNSIWTQRIAFLIGLGLTVWMALIPAMFIVLDTYGENRKLYPWVFLWMWWIFASGVLAHTLNFTCLRSGMYFLAWIPAQLVSIGFMWGGGCVFTWLIGG